MYENKEIQACKIIKDHIFIHAGLTKDWCKRYHINLKGDIEQQVNDLFYKDLYAFCFQDAPKQAKLSQYTDGYGNNTWQSPFWVRPDSLIKNKLKGYIQVVGHTPQRTITKKSDVWFTDTNSKEILKLEL